MTNTKLSKSILRQFQNLFFFAPLILAIVFGLATVTALRSNNQKMVELRTAVFKADEQNGDIETALKNLREYVFAHMNTNLSSGANAVKPPIQLKYRYERLVAQEKANFDAANAKMLNEAEAYCVAQFPGTVFSQPRLNCAKDYAASHPVKQNSIPDDLYKFDFASPKWSPDLAGWCMVLTGLFLFIFLFIFAFEFLNGKHSKQRM